MNMLAYPEAEQSLLGAILADNDVLLGLPENFTAEHFSEPVHQRIFSLIRDERDCGRRADALAMKPLLDNDPALSDIGGGKYLGKLVGASLALVAPAETAESLLELAERRRVLQACQNAVQRISDPGNASAGEIAAELSAALESANQTCRWRISTERQVSARITEQLAKKGAASFSQTGIKRLDNAMQGGMFAGKLYGIVGRKKMGKSMLAGTISHNLQHSGVKHVYIALEMGSDELQQRSLARQLNCYESSFRTGFGESGKFIERLADYSTTAKNYRIYLDAPGISFAELRHILPVMIKKYKLQGFILDCWQLVTGKQKGMSTAEHQDTVAQWLAECVKKHGVWGLVTAQENQDENTRGGEGIRLACDQLYRLCKHDETSERAWLEMMDTRYTKWNNVGSEHDPALFLNEKGPYFESIA